MHVLVKGFVNNMEQWMNACDMIITKAGPGTIAEAYICGLPVLLNAFVPCQEEGNIEYVVRNQTGIFSRDPQTIAATVEVRNESVHVGLAAPTDMHQALLWTCFAVPARC